MMITSGRWVERSFKFDLPLAMFPGVVERLRGTPARLADRLGGLPEDIRRQRSGDGWSIQEHAGHLLELESLWSERIKEFANGVHVLRAADMSNRKTTEAGYNNKLIADILLSFKNARLEMIAVLEALDEEAIRRTAMHPRLMQPMNVLDFAFFVAEHDDHHLVKITEILVACTKH
ncbi:MAG: DinB family protein [Bacteroidota bacterium]